MKNRRENCLVLILGDDILLYKSLFQLFVIALFNLTNPGVRLESREVKGVFPRKLTRMQFESFCIRVSI